LLSAADGGSHPEPTCGAQVCLKSALAAQPPTWTLHTTRTHPAPSVETLRIPVLPQCYRLDGRRPYPCRPPPAPRSRRDELQSVVALDVLRHSMRHEHP
jgi:hypothetical protein